MTTRNLLHSQSAIFKEDGEMGRLIMEYDWAPHLLGRPESWSPGLLMLLRLVLNSKFPMLLCWGPELIQFYNDDYKDILSRFSKHPGALGQPLENSWPEIWHQVKPLIDQALLKGRSTLTENFPFRYQYNNHTVESYWTFSISPLYDHYGTSAGILLICHESTDLLKSHKNVSRLLEEEQAMNEELFAMNEELNEANAALVSANDEIRMFDRQLRDSENKYKTLFQLSPMPMWMYDPETLKIVEVNDMAVRKYGYNREEFLTKSLLDIRPKGEVPEFLNAIERVKHKRDLHCTGVFRHLNKNGNIMLVEVYGHHFEYQGKSCVMVVANDITEKESALKQLAEKEERLTTATTIAKLGYWQVNVDGTNRFWSDEVFNIWMVSRDTDLNDSKYLMGRVHPNDREYFTFQYDTSLHNIQDIDMEYRLTMPDGTTKWVHEIGKVVKDENQKPLRIQGTIQDITSQKMLALSLQESNERFQYAAQATSQAIWEWDAEQPELFKEYGYRELFGYELNQNKGTVEFWRSKVHPEDYERIWSLMEAARLNTDIGEWTLEYRFKKADGTYLNIKEKAILLRKEGGLLHRMIGSMHDITRRKKEERHLRLLESVITNTRDGVFITFAAPWDEPDSMIIYANESFAKMTGYSISELVGKTPSIFQGAFSDKAELSRLNEALRKQQPCEVNTISYKKNGEKFWANISVSPLSDENGVVSHFIAIQRDITEKKKAEMEFKLFADDLFKRNQELEQFGYVVSHNLRSPVANIMGMIDTLRLYIDDQETIQKCADSLKFSVIRLDDVIRDISKILSITDNSAELIRETVDPGNVLIKIIEDLNDTIEQLDVKFEMSLCKSLVVAKNAYLYSIFYNLITNAIKYRSHEPLKIKINMVLKKDVLLITFSDNGLGIDLSRHAGEIFRPYRRFHTEIEGKGLGLFLVKCHVEALKGSIQIESQPGAGTTFNIRMPVAGEYPTHL